MLGRSTILVAFACMAAGILAASCLLRGPTKEIFVLRSGFTGPVVVLYGVEGGELPIKAPSDEVIIEVPSTGVVKLRTLRVRSSAGPDYFYRRDDGTLQKIVYLDHWGNDRPSFDNLTPDEKRDGIYAMNAGGLGSFTSDGKQVQFTSFTVGHPEDAERLYLEMVDLVFEQTASRRVTY